MLFTLASACVCVGTIFFREFLNLSPSQFIRPLFLHALIYCKYLAAAPSISPPPRYTQKTTPLGSLRGTPSDNVYEEV